MGSGSPNTHVAAGVPFNVPVVFTMGERVAFQDGTALQLTGIGDSRCKPDVQCIWAGELSPEFVLYDTDLTSQAFMLGTVRTRRATVKDKVVVLQDATNERVTVIVSKE